MRWDLYTSAEKMQVLWVCIGLPVLPAGGMAGKRLDGCRRIEEGPQSRQSTRQQDR